MIRFLLLSVLLVNFFYTYSAKPTSPDLKTPTNHQIDYDDGLFMWKTSVDSDGGTVFYDFYIGTSPSNLTLLQADIYDGFVDGDFFAQADGDDFYFGFISPVPNATFYWKVVAKDEAGSSTESQTWSFTTSNTNYAAPTKPDGPQPAIGTTNIDHKPLLQWAQSTDADGDIVTYELYLDTVASPAARIASNIAANAYKVSTILKGNKTYFWKVVANDGRGLSTAGNVWNFTTTNTEPAPASLVAPANNATNVAYNQQLQWLKSADPDKDIKNYEVWYGQAGHDPLKVITTATALSVTLQAATQYSWYVITTDTHGARVTSEVRTFTTAQSTNQSPGAPVATAPQNNSTGVALNPVLLWSAATDPDQDAVYYDVYVGTTPTGLEQVARELTGNSFLKELLPNTKYYWKVIAYDKKGGATESAVSAFTTTPQDVGVTKFEVYYRYRHATQVYQFLSSPITPGFEKGIKEYSAKGRNAMNDALAVVFYYTSPATTISFDLPPGFTATSSIIYNYGLPTGASVAYQIEGNFTAHTAIKFTMTEGNAQRSYSIDAQVNELPQMPQLLTPADDAQNVSTKPTFTWGQGNDPDGSLVIYRLQVGTSPTNLNQQGSVTNAKTIVYPGTGLLPAMKYYWKIVAQDAMGETIESDVFSFITEKAGGTGGLALSYPRAISTYVETDVELRWQYDPQKNALYDLYLDTQNPPRRIVNGLVDSRYPVASLANSTTYYWKVVARNADGTSGESAVQSFRTKPAGGSKTGVFTDARDGQLYQWVEIGKARWMVHNLAYQPQPQDGYNGYQYYFDDLTGEKEYFVLDNAPDNLKKYGYLYNWTGAMNAAGNPQINIPRRGVCPSGWHIPTHAEWDALFLSAAGNNGSVTLGNNTIFYNTWPSVQGKENDWLNSAGLSVLPSGYRMGTDITRNTGSLFWLADKDSLGGQGLRYQYSEQAKQLAIATDVFNALTGGASVRCVENTNQAPTKPALKTPANQTNAQSFDIRLEWNASTDPEGDALTYRLYLDTAETPVRQLAVQPGALYYDVKGLPQNTRYYWKVEVLDAMGNSEASDVWSFSTKANSANAVPDKPLLISPANLANDVSTSPTFQWAQLTDSDGDPVSADLYYGTSSNNLILAASDLTGTSYTLSGARLASLTKYLWRLVAKDGHGGVAASDGGLFTTANNAPPAPILTAPANGATYTLIMQTLAWQPVTDADGDPVTYTLYVGQSPTALTLYADNIAMPYYNFGSYDTPLDTDFYWQVVAKDNHGVSSASAVWKFRTYSDYDATTVVNLLSPASGAANVSLNPVLTWTAIAGRKYDVYLEQGVKVLVANDLTSSTFTVTGWMGANKLKPHTGYAWHVVAKTAAGDATEAVRSFTTLNSAPAQPTLLAPADLAVNQSYTPVLKWQESIDADGDNVVYDVVIGTTSNPSQTVASGLASSSFTMPAYALSPNTKYYWKVIAKDMFGGATASVVQSFTVRNNTQNSTPAIPTLLEPANYTGSVTGQPVLRWKTSPDIDGDVVVYDVYLATNTTFTTPLAKDLSGISYTVAQPILPHTKYYWKVVVRDNRGGEAGSTTWSFTSANRNPGAVTLSAPVDGVMLTTEKAMLTWSAISDPDGDAVLYDVYLDTNQSPVIRVAEGIATTAFETDVLQNNVTYYWKVVARDDFGGEISSTTGKFIGKNNPPQTPGLLSPLNGSTLADISLSWLKAQDPEGGVVAYEVILDNNPTPVTRVATVEGDLSFATPGLVAGKTYYWKIRAKDAFGATAESAIWSFTYDPAAVNQPPAAPTLLTPLNNSTDVGLQPVVSWTAAADPEGDAITYSLYADQTPAAATLVAENITVTTFTLDTQPEGATLYWRVVAVDDHNNTTGSQTWKFTTLTLPPAAYSVAGTIADNNGQPIAGVRIEGFPEVILTDAVGHYIITVPAGWSGHVAPVSADRTFDPPSRNYSNVNADVEDDDYVATLINGIEGEPQVSLSVYPNPTGGSAHVLLDRKLAQGGKLVLINSHGQAIARLAVDPGQQEVVWDGTDAAGNALRQGMYYAQLYSDKRLLTVIKIVIIK